MANVHSQGNLRDGAAWTSQRMSTIQGGSDESVQGERGDADAGCTDTPGLRESDLDDSDDEHARALASAWSGRPDTTPFVPSTQEVSGPSIAGTKGNQVRQTSERASAELPPHATQADRYTEVEPTFTPSSRVCAVHALSLIHI